MAEHSAIEWTDATVNFWWGCTKVGPGCDHCYAETWSRRTGGEHWGVGATRREIKGAPKLIYKLQNSASWFYADHDRRRRVFVQSMSDLFDLEVPVEWFAVAWGCIVACDSLAVQIVTKRVSAVEKRLAAIGATGWPKNAGLIVSVVDQAEADRDVPRLLDLKKRLGIPWVGLSMEPLLGEVDLTKIVLRRDGQRPTDLSSRLGDYVLPLRGAFTDSPTLDWVIVGGESGPGARPMHPDWARSLRDQCAGAGVPFLFKQWGEFSDFEHIGELWNDLPNRTRVNQQFVDGRAMIRVGKRAAGRLLDGRTHDGFPA